MRRGSVHTWEDYGRRSSANMSPFSGSRAEFMTIDDIEYKRNDGWFLSYSKLAAVIVVFVIGVLAAGFLGWYINTVPKKKTYDTLDVIAEEMEDDLVVDTSFSPYVIPIKYFLDLTPMPSSGGNWTINGRMAFEFQVKGSLGLNEISLNIKNIIVTEYRLFSLNEDELRTKRSFVQNQTQTVNDYITSVYGDAKDVDIMEYKEDEYKEVCTLYFAKSVGDGVYLLMLDYEALINDETAYIETYEGTNERWLLISKLNPLLVRNLFPVYEDATVKTSFFVSVTSPKGTHVLTNTPLKVVRDGPDDQIIHLFDETPPLAAHNLALAVGYFELTDETFIADSKIRATFWAGRRSQGTYLASKLEPAIINLIDMFSMPYPLAKLDLLALPAGISENIGKLGLISIKDSVWHTSNESRPVTKIEALRSLIYLLGQQWLEGIVNMNRTDTWVSESSLLYLEYMLADKLDSSLDSSHSFLGNIQFEVMENDGYSVARSLQTNAHHLYPDSFIDQNMKGACLLRMLHTALGDSSFINGYRNFIGEWKYKTTNAFEFFNAIADNATEIPSGFSLQELIDSWVLQNGYPIVFVRKDNDTGITKIRQAQFTYDLLLDESDTLWHIPLTYVNESSSWSFPEIIWMLSEREINLENIGGNDSWIVFNVNKTGYYRVCYDEMNWMLLSEVLQQNHEIFPSETRASLIDDIFSLAAVGLVKYETTFAFIKYMQMKERHYAPWEALRKHLFKLSRLLYETSVFTNFQEFVLDFITPLYNEFGLERDNGSQLSLVSIQMACEFEHAECLSRSKEVFTYIQADDQARQGIPEYLRKTIYCTIARYGAKKEWAYFLENATQIIDKEERERFLSAMSCFQTPWILQAVLNEIVYGTSFNDNEIPIILRAFPENPAAAQVASKFVRVHWGKIIERFPGSYLIWRSFILSVFNGLTTEEDLEDFLQFRESNYEDIKGARYSTAIVEANANFVTTWMKNSLSQISDILSGNSTVLLSKLEY